MVTRQTAFIREVVSFGTIHSINTVQYNLIRSLWEPQVATQTVVESNYALNLKKNKKKTDSAARKKEKGKNLMVKAEEP